MITHRELNKVKKVLLKNVEPFARKIAPIFEHYNLAMDDGVLPNAQDIRNILNVLIHSLCESETSFLLMTENGIIVGYNNEEGYIRPVMRLNIDYDMIIKVK